jgi:pimeloyl-ACP methyl ester carboxylesterase
MPFLNLRDLDFYYETAGDPAAPPLLILSGLTDYTAKCEWQMAELADDFHVITFDNRGAGRSTQPPPGYSAADMADDAAAFLDALDIPAVHVFGFSMGGMIALNFTLRHPARVRRLALGCTTAGGRFLVRPETRVMESLTNPVSCGDPRQDFYNGLWISLGDRSRQESPELVERLADLAVANPQTPSGYAGQLAAVLTHDVADRLGEIHAPTLVLHGTADRLIPLENGRLLAENIPGARLILYANAGHLFFVERAAEVNRDLRHFLIQEAATDHAAALRQS